MKNNSDKKELATVTSSLEQNGADKAGSEILAHVRKLNIPIIDWDVQILPWWLKINAGSKYTTKCIKMSQIKLNVSQKSNYAQVSTNI